MIAWTGLGPGLSFRIGGRFDSGLVNDAAQHDGLFGLD